MDRAEFDKHFKIRKHFAKEFKPPKNETKGVYKLIGDNGFDYSLDYQIGFLGNIKLEFLATETKQKLQTRVAQTYMVRLEVNAPPHMDSITGKLSRNHIHFCYPDGIVTHQLEGYDKEKFLSLDYINMLRDFLILCNIDISEIKFQGVV